MAVSEKDAKLMHSGDEGVSIRLVLQDMDMKRRFLEKRLTERQMYMKQLATAMGEAQAAYNEDVRLLEAIKTAMKKLEELNA